MFADDVVLVATSFSKLDVLFGHMCNFCAAEQLTISATKTKLLVSGAPSPAIGASGTVTLHGYVVEVVTEFRYLGLHFDQRASTPHMLSALLLKARTTFFWLLKFVTG